MTEVEAILDERERTHGNFAASAAIAQALKLVMSQAPKAAELDHVKLQALDMIATKIARIVCGDSEHADAWIDIEGYAELVVRDLQTRAQP